MYDALIIGAGMSGLAAGIRLAGFQKRVCLVERQATIGGLNTFYRLRGRQYDTALHALTNYAPAHARHSPLARVLRQLRLSRDDLALAPQVGSSIIFPSARLEFSNDFELLRSEVRRCFPRQEAALARLADCLPGYDQLGQPAAQRPARQVLREFLDDPLLVEILLCPLLFYGAAQEGDLEFGQFAILFRSVYLEGLARPFEGIRRILTCLADRFTALGGQLRLGAGVRRLAARDGRVEAVLLEDGTELTARHVLSCAGWRETMRLCGQPERAASRPAGRISLVESIWVLCAEPKDLGLDRTAVFYSCSDVLRHGRPEELVDLGSGVVSTSNNFLYDRPLPEGIVRLTALASYPRWAALDPDSYREAKLRCVEAMAASACRFVPDFRPAVIDRDAFTPVTIQRYTGHDEGAVYGSPQKQYDGTTHLENLFICGADQGLVGIVGALWSGITIANKHVLHREEA
ncbi:MAG: phytoene desaturase family protein [Thermoguttaceae bacterium]